MMKRVSVFVQQSVLLEKGVQIGLNLSVVHFIPCGRLNSPMALLLSTIIVGRFVLLPFRRDVNFGSRFISFFVPH